MQYLLSAHSYGVVLTLQIGLNVPNFAARKFNSSVQNCCAWTYATCHYIQTATSDAELWLEKSEILFCIP